MVLICISMLTSHVECLFMYLLAMRNVCSGPLPIFKVGYLCVFAIELSSSYILDINPSDTLLTNIFSNPIGGCFTLLISSFAG